MKKNLLLQTILNLQNYIDQGHILGAIYLEDAAKLCEINNRLWSAINIQKNPPVPPLTNEGYENNTSNIKELFQKNPRPRRKSI